MAQFKNTSPVVLDLGDGRMVAPGDTATVDPAKAPTDLVEARHLKQVSAARKKTTTAAKES